MCKAQDILLLLIWVLLKVSWVIIFLNLGNPSPPVYIPPSQLAIGSNTVTQSYYGIQTTATETTFWNDIKTNLNVSVNISRINVLSKFNLAPIVSSRIILSIIQLGTIFTYEYSNDKLTSHDGICQDKRAIHVHWWSGWIHWNPYLKLQKSCWHMTLANGIHVFYWVRCHAWLCDPRSNN